MASIGRLKRGRTRDYTIPVRLNQQHPHHNQVAPSPREIMPGARTFVKQLLPYLLALILVVIASTCVQQSHCDNSPKSSLAAKNHSPQSRDAIDSSKQRLLAMLSENIERQHLNKHTRPSKIDSSDDLLVVETLHAIPSISQHSTVQTKPPTAATKKSKIKTLSAEEQALRDIMRMHEQPTQTYHANLPPQPNQSEKPARVSRPSSLLSYISAPKLLDGAAKMIKLEPTHLSNLTARPFTGRSTGGPATTPSPIFMHKYPFLTLPRWLTRSKQSASTKPSTMFGDANNSRDWMMSTAASDLMASADSSGSNELQATVAQSAAPRPGGSRQNRGNKALSSETEDTSTTRGRRGSTLAAKWLKNQLAQNYLHDSLRGLLTLSQLPILPGGPVSTAPSVLEPRPPVSQQQQQRRRVFANKQQQQPIESANATVSSPSRRTKALEDLYRYAYILGTSMISRKRDPLKALSAKPTIGASQQAGRPITQRSIGQLAADNRRQMINLAKALQQALFGLQAPGGKQQVANPRGVMWDMATDPTLVVTLMHMIERASVALPLGFLLMPLVQMIRMNPLGGINHLSRMLPARALHRSVEHELLAKRLDAVDKVLSRALRPTHREG